MSEFLLDESLAGGAREFLGDLLGSNLEEVRVIGSSLGFIILFEFLEGINTIITVVTEDISLFVNESLDFNE